MKQILSSLMVLTLAVSSLSGTVVACDNSRKTGTTNEDYANRIRDKITQPNVTVNSTSDELETNVPAEDYAQAITNALKADNTQLASAINAATNAGAKVSFDYNGDLSVNETTTIETQIIVGNYKTNPFKMQVSLAANDTQKVQMLNNKIDKLSNIVVENTSPSLAANTDGIKTALRNLNPSLTAEDVSHITFEGGPLTLGSAVAITGVITYGDQSKKFSLNVTLAQTNAQKARAIEEKIIDDNISLSAQYNNETITSATISAIKNALQTANPTLTDDDLSAITIPTTEKLTSFKNNRLIATITQGTGTGASTAIFAINIKINNTWQAVDSNVLRNTSGAGEVTRFQDPGTTTYTYYWPTGSGLFTSSDGVSWTKNTSLPTNFASYASVVKIGDAYYLSSYNLGLFRSTDGKTWSNVIPSTSAAIFFSTPYRISGTSPIFASSESKGLWYSTDDGGTWTQVNASGVSGNLPSDVKLRKPFVKIGDTYYLTTINHGLWKTNSIINGGTWTQVTVGSTTTNLDIRSEVTKIGDTYYLDTYKNGLYTSDNGTTWTKNQTIPDNINAFWGVKEINGTYYLASDAGGLFTSKTGTTWSRVGSSFFDNRNILGFRRPPVFLNNTYYIGSNQDGLWSSSDGQTWTPTNLTRNATLAYSNFRVYSNPSLVGGKLYLPTLGQGLWSLT